MTKDKIKDILDRIDTLQVNLLSLPKNRLKTKPNYKNGAL